MLQAHAIGKLIGPGGSHIKQLTRDTGTFVNIPKERPPPFNIDVKAHNPADLARAMEAISRALEGTQGMGASGQAGQLIVP